MFKLLFKPQKKSLCMIISAPRSGSTWLQKILNSHPEAFCTEHRFFGEFFEVWPDNPEKKAPRITLDYFVEMMARHYQYRDLEMTSKDFSKLIIQDLIKLFHNFAYANSPKKPKLIADKVTPYLGTFATVASSVNSFVPQAKVVFLIRDGRDVLTSGVFDWLARKNDGSNRHRKYVEGDQSAEFKRFFNNDDIETWSSYWNESIKTVDLINAPKHVVHFEDLKNNQTETLHDLFSFLHLKTSSKIIKSCIEQNTFDRMSRGRKAGEMEATAKVRKGVVGDWRNFFTLADGTAFHQRCGHNMRRWGYAPSDIWLESLPKTLDQSQHLR